MGRGDVVGICLIGPVVSYVRIVLFMKLLMRVVLMVIVFLEPDILLSLIRTTAPLVIAIPLSTREMGITRGSHSI
jgi:hypothetical protein